jgi:predicted DNA-binding transcriptional regulator AlpA
MPRRPRPSGDGAEEVLRTVADAADRLPSLLPPDRIPSALGIVERLRSSLNLALLESATRPIDDHLLDTKDAAKLLGTTDDWLYRHAASLPFTVHLSSGQVRFSALGLQAYIRKKAGRMD